MLMLTTSSLLNAQFVLKGKIYQQGQLLPNANVVLSQTFLQTATNNNGEFEFRNLKNGDYTLIISYLGFETKSQQVHLTSDTVISLDLNPASVISSEVVVESTRKGNQNIASTSILKQELEEKNLGHDVPFLLNQTTSVITTTDAGTGIGYSGIRIRGSDASRINVTINGIPINDAESQNMYWVNLPDFVSSVENIQLQRGIGSSTNGAGAFGGSVNILSNGLSNEPYAQSSNAFGSFNTLKNNIALGSGLLNQHWCVEGRLSRIKSDGYIDRASSDLKSYYVSGGYLSKKTLVKANIFSGHEVTYQSWYGVPQVRVNNDSAGIIDFINNNNLDDEDAANLLNSQRNYNYYTYENQVDNYQQDHYQLLFSHEISDAISLHLAAHYTKGKGYFEEYKKANDAFGGGLFSSYNLPDLIIGSDTIVSTNLIRRKWLDNDFYGITYSLNYEMNQNLQWNIGGAWNQYDGDHYSEIIWAQYAGNAPIRYRYESDNALKTDFNIYGKANYLISKNLEAFIDLQTRTVNYQFNGIDDALNTVPQKETLHFFNPKAGATLRINPSNTVYASASVGNKEPSRDDYVEHINKPEPESMIDYEAGYRFKSQKLLASVNFYYMDYKNQLVVTGQLNEVGNPIRSNTGKSYRGGAEVELKYIFNSKWSLDANATFSKNKIKTFTEYVDDWDTYGQRQINYSNVSIAYSPSIISAVSLTWKPIEDLHLQLIEKYVGQQYLDNTQNQSRLLEPYQCLDVRINYTLHNIVVPEILFGIMLNNVLNEMYSTNGYTYAHFSGDRLYADNYLYPQAGFNVLGQITFKF